MRSYKKNLGITLDSVIIGAISKAADATNSVSALAEKMRLPVGRVRLWVAPNLARPIKTIPWETYKIVYPHIRDYLPADDPRYLPRAQNYPEFKPPDIEGREPPAPYLADPEADELARHLPPEMLAEIKAELSKLYHEKITLAAARLFLESRRAQ